jgi:hypothetical protein
MREQTWQKCQVVDGFANLIARAKSHARKAGAPGDLLFYPLPSPNANFLRDDLFLSFAFRYGSLQTTTNAKLICQSL